MRSQLRHSSPTQAGRRAKPVVSAEYVVGLTDGEGCFKKHPLQSISKQKSFEVFCTIAELVQQGVHHTGAGIKKIQRLKTRVNYRARVVREIRSLRGDAK